MAGPQRYPPIGDYALLSDCHSWALVSRDGSVDWCCFYRAGGHTTFSRILDWDTGGYFRIAPAADAGVTRRYLEDTNVLATRFETADGVVEVTDLLPVSTGSAGGLRPRHQLLRRVRGVAGTVDVEVEIHPRFDYGLTTPHVRLEGQHTAEVVGGPDALTVRSDVPLGQDDRRSCHGTVRLEGGEERFVTASYRRAHESRGDGPGGAGELTDRIDRTVAFWRDWAARADYGGPHRDAVVRSALVLKALTDAPTGAILAAPTTSLPEQLGGVRNWDYRFTWIRDAALHLSALSGLGYTAEAEAFMGWVARTTAGSTDDLQVLYGPDGSRRAPEITLDGLEGYRGSAPVRIGNGATGQFQLDLYGQLLDTAWQYVRHGGELSDELAHLLADTVGVVADRWREPDAGLWEQRGDTAHFVSSKLYAWVAADRAGRLARDGHLDLAPRPCRELARRIRARLERDGTDPDGGWFLRAFGGRELDASSLLLPLEGFLPPDDPRVEATVDAVAEHLTSDGIVHRYRHRDGLPGGDEGGFPLCTCWLISCLADRGETDRARRLFEDLLDRSNDLGLLSEEIRPGDGALMGNFPQAISHAGVINTAQHLAGSAASNWGDQSPT